MVRFVFRSQDFVLSRISGNPLRERLSIFNGTQRPGDTVKTVLKTPATVLLVRRYLYSRVLGIDGPPQTLTKNPKLSTHEGFFVDRGGGGDIRE